MKPLPCPENEETLALLVSDDLAADEASRLRAHMAGCVGCRASFEAYCDDIRWMRQQRHTPPAVMLVGPEFAARVAATAAKQRQPFGASALRLVGMARRFVRRAPRAVLARFGQEGVVIGLCAGVVLVGAIGLLERPLRTLRSGPHHLGATMSLAGLGAEEIAMTESSAGAEGDQDFDDTAGDEESVGKDETAMDTADWGDEGERATRTAADQRTELAGTTFASDDLRIELQTHDPNVRIIWFAQKGTP